MWWIYILKCSDESYYVGLTDDVDRRLAEHRQKIGAKHTKVRGVRSVVYKEFFESIECASAREKQLKKWSRAKKEALIAQDFKKLQELSASKDKR